MVQSIPQDLIDKLDRRAHAERKLAQTLRRHAEWDEEIRDAIVRFYAAGGITEQSQGGLSNGREQR